MTFPSITLNIRRTIHHKNRPKRIDKLVADVLLISTETAAMASMHLSKCLKVHMG